MSCKYLVMIVIFSTASLAQSEASVSVYTPDEGFYLYRRLPLMVGISRGMCTTLFYAILV